MPIETILSYSAVAWLAIASPGPAILLALRNGSAFGVRATLWSSLGNITGIFVLSATAMMGLGVLLMSSALLFGVVKTLGALYLFYVGLRHLLGRSSVVNRPSELSDGGTSANPRRLYREGVLLAVTNPKPILFFTALFPQFVNTAAPLLPQFFVLTGIFMALSFITLSAYALVAGRARSLLVKPNIVKWINRVVGSIFISFGAALLALRRQAT